MEDHEHGSWPEGQSEALGKRKRVAERRNYHRKECDVRAEYELEGKEYAALVKDVSLGGMCLEVSSKPDIGDRIVVTLLSGGKRTDIVLSGVIAYVLEADGCLRVGVEFDQIDQAAVDVLAFYLAL